MAHGQQHGQPGQTSQTSQTSHTSAHTLPPPSSIVQRALPAPSQQREPREPIHSATPGYVIRLPRSPLEACRVYRAKPPSPQCQMLKLPPLDLALLGLPSVEEWEEGWSVTSVAPVGRR